VNLIKGPIPTIDLNDDRDKQVIVDKEKNRYLAHVSAVRYSVDNCIYAAYMRGHGRGQALLKKSRDFGDSWSERLKVPDTWLTLLQVPTLYEIEHANRKNQLLMITGHLPIRSSLYDPDKEVWSDLEPIGDFGGNVSMSSLIKLPDGRYIGFFHDDGRYINKDRNDSRFRLYKSTSDNDIRVELARSQMDDEGQWSKETLDATTQDDSTRVWSNREVIYESYFGQKRKGDVSKIYKVIYHPETNQWDQPEVILSDTQAYLAEAGACLSPDGRQLLLLMRDNTRKHNSFIATSNDYGQTWSKPVQGPTSLTGDRHIIKYTPDGRLVCVFRDTKLGSTTYGDWVAWVGRYEDILKGRGGQYRIRLKKNYEGVDCGYSGLEIRDHTLVAMSYGHWTENEKPYILCVKVNLDEIDEFLKDT